jgi:hypothetical protein
MLGNAENVNICACEVNTQSPQHPEATHIDKKRAPQGALLVLSKMKEPSNTHVQSLIIYI